MKLIYMYLMYSISAFKKSCLHIRLLTSYNPYTSSSITKLYYTSQSKKNNSIRKPSSRYSKENNPKNELEIDGAFDRPFTLPPGEFRPKQSLGQNFLTDQNYVKKIVNSLIDTSPNGHKVIEIGPGAGALTKLLYERYPEMTAIELDQRSVAFLNKKLPELKIMHQDVLTVDWPLLAEERGGRVNIIANLPYYIVSQVLFSLADSHKSINQAVLTMQLEVAQRLTAVPKTKDYGIPSVVFQLYCNTPKMLFKIPPTVFYPVPKVDSALVAFDFTRPHPGLETVCLRRLRKILSESFQHRRKMLRQSLKDLLQNKNIDIDTTSSSSATVSSSGGGSNTTLSGGDGSDPSGSAAVVVIPGMGLPVIRELPEPWATRRPEELTPVQFIELTRLIYGSIDPCYSHNSTVIHDITAPTTSVTGVTARTATSETDSSGSGSSGDESLVTAGKAKYQSQSIWRNTRM